MPCSDSPSPIDIRDSDIKGNNCIERCKYSHSYQQLKDINVEHKTTHFLFTTTLINEDKPDVIFNNQKYNVKKIYLFRTPLHTYNSISPDGEIIIKLSSGRSRDLNISIPLKEDNSTTSRIDFIIDDIKKICTKGAQGCIVPISKMDISPIVPNKQYYYYQGENEYITQDDSLCNNIENWIVFKKEDSYTINSSTLDYLENQLTSIDNINRAISPNITLSKNIPQAMESGGDDIYIDCQLTGEDGEILVEHSKDKLNIDMSSSFEEIFKNRLFIFIISILLITFIFSVYYMGVKTIIGVLPDKSIE